MDVPMQAYGWAGGWSAFVVLAFVLVRAVVKGDLVPRRTAEREIERAEHEANEWRAESRIRDQQIQVLHELGAEKDKQIGTVFELGTVVNSAMNEIKDMAREQRARRAPRKQGDE